MAITASLSVGNSSKGSGQRTTITCVITNTGGSNVNVTNVTPSATGGTCNPGQVVFTPESTTTVPGSSGTLTLTWPFIGYATIQDGNPNPSTSFGIGVTIYTDDGSVTTSSNTPYVQVYDPNTYTAPGPGSMRFDSNHQSALYPVVL